MPGARRRRSVRRARSRSTRRRPTSTRSARRSGCAGPTRPARCTCATRSGSPPRLVAYPAAESYDIDDRRLGAEGRARARFDTAFAPPSSLAGLEAALADLPAGRFERARELAERCRELLLAAGHEVVTEPGQATLVSFRSPDDPATARGRALRARRHRARHAGHAICCAPPSAGGTTRATSSASSHGASRLGRRQAELARDRLQRGDHVRDVLVERRARAARRLRRRRRATRRRRTTAASASS